MSSNLPSPMVARHAGDELQQRFSAQREAFHRRTPDYDARMEALTALQSGLLRFESDLVAALNADFGNRAQQETQVLEIFPVVDGIRHAKRHLRSWMRSRSVLADWQTWPSRARILQQPLGVVGIVGAWNYPVFLTLSPLVSALAAGNHAMLKPSETAPATADVVSRMIADIYPSDYVTVVTGGPEIGATFSALGFDHLIFTGSARVGKLVMSSAAENLTPVTLELGGKSPALVHGAYPLGLAADRICSAKIWNAGQTCVAPDYVLVPNAGKDLFIAKAKQAIVRRLPRLCGNPDYTHMVDRQSWERMSRLVDDARQRGAEVIHVNPAGEDWTGDGRVYPPTLVANVNDSMRIMQEEIFGPVLPIVAYDTLDEAIAFINARARPLALYYFDTNSGRIRRVLERTISGGVAVNDCVLHVGQNNLPFGGVGPSGMGAYHGVDGFRTFSKRKGVFFQSRFSGWLIDRLLKPPYSRWSDLLIRFLIGRAGMPRRHSSR